jgi:hypothetical protein
MKGFLRDPGGPTGAIERSSMGALRKGEPERSAELRSGVGPIHTTVEAAEGNEAVEGRDRPEGTLHEYAKVRTQSRVALPTHLVRVNEAAKHGKRARFTALLHHVDVLALERAFRRLKRSAAAGVDGQSVADYEQSLQDNLSDLCTRVHTGRYQPQPGASSLHRETRWRPAPDRSTRSGRQDRPRDGG